MKSFNDEVYSILKAAEADGSLGSSVTANKIINAARNTYAHVTDAEKQEIFHKIESLKKQPGVTFPTNYKELISS